MKLQLSLMPNLQNVVNLFTNPTGLQPTSPENIGMNVKKGVDRQLRYTTSYCVRLNAGACLQAGGKTRDRAAC